MIIPDGYAQINIRFTGTGAPTGAEITCGVNLDIFPGTPADLAQKALVYFQSAAIRARLSSEVTISSCVAKYGPNATGPSAEFTLPVAGTGPSAASSPNTAWLVRKNTGFGGRTGRGRWYIPGIVDGSVFSNGVIIGGEVTLMTTALEAWRTSMTTDGVVPTLLHGAASPVQVPMPITSFVTDFKVATQRRRLRR